MLKVQIVLSVYVGLNYYFKYLLQQTTVYIYGFVNHNKEILWSCVI